MYILKDIDNNIISYSTDKNAIEDAKIFLNMLDATVESTDENIIKYEGKGYLQTDWDNYIKTNEYKYNEAKKEAIAEIAILKQELTENDYKIIKAMEALISKTDAPYNMEELLSSRNSKRYRINELQTSFQIT